MNILTLLPQKTVGKNSYAHNLCESLNSTVLVQIKNMLPTAYDFLAFVSDSSYITDDVNHIKVWLMIEYIMHKQRQEKSYVHSPSHHIRQVFSSATGMNDAFIKKLTDTVYGQGMYDQAIVDKETQKSGEIILLDSKEQLITLFFGTCYDFLAACSEGNHYSDQIDAMFLNQLKKSNLFGDTFDYIESIDDVEDIAKIVFGKQNFYIAKNHKNKPNATTHIKTKLLGGEIEQSIGYIQNIYVSSFVKQEVVLPNTLEQAQKSSIIGDMHLATIHLKVRDLYNQIFTIVVEYIIPQDNRKAAIYDIVISQKSTESVYTELIKHKLTNIVYIQGSSPIGSNDMAISEKMEPVLQSVQSYLSMIHANTYRSSQSGEFVSNSFPSKSQLVEQYKNTTLYLKQGLLPNGWMYGGDGWGKTIAPSSPYYTLMTRPTEELKAGNAILDASNVKAIISLGGGDMHKEKDIMKDKNLGNMTLYCTDLSVDNQVLGNKDKTDIVQTILCDYTIDTSPIQKIRDVVSGNVIFCEFGGTFGNSINANIWDQKDPHKQYISCIAGQKKHLQDVYALMQEGDSFIFDVATTDQTHEQAKLGYSHHDYMMTQYTNQAKLGYTFDGVKIVSSPDSTMGEYFVTTAITRPESIQYSINDPEGTRSKIELPQTLLMIPSYRFNLNYEGANSLRTLCQTIGFIYSVVYQKSGIARIQCIKGVA